MQYSALLGLLLSPALAVPKMLPYSFKAAMALYPNCTNSTEPHEPSPSCFPFADPYCCINHPVCQCNNGTFFGTNEGHDGGDLCDPPGSLRYGDDSSALPGFCCEKL
ncbi:hypothetical protein F4780DRAFT_776138 [Xylariomycetidae sp. FL0641]|nr:hypothetical protein F4780DRAFT_776138 [Xylariomycetidae sp. FL0641]